MHARQPRLPFEPSDPSETPPAGPIAKLELLQSLVQVSPSIYPEKTRDTFLTLIWLTLADLGALPAAPQEQAVA